MKYGVYVFKHAFTNIERYPEKQNSQKAGLIPPGKMPGSPRITNMGIQLGIEDVGNHHSGMFVNLKDPKGKQCNSLSLRCRFLSVQSDLLLDT